MDPQRWPPIDPRNWPPLRFAQIAPARQPATGWQGPAAATAKRPIIRVTLDRRAAPEPRTTMPCCPSILVSTPARPPARSST
jgi:hypothetical protein